MTELTICPSVPIWKLDGGLFFDRKFYSGMIAYCNEWNGSIHLIIRVADSVPPEFGLVKLDINTFPAKVTLIGQNEVLDSKHIHGADIILASGDNHKNLHLSRLCKQQGVKCIYIIEYILETRFQIINMANLSHWKKLKSLVWTVLTELKRRNAFRLAEGIQANGVPSFKAYKKLVGNSLLYFDTRNNAKTNITEAELSARLSALDKNDRIRLGFSGRLIKMKGVDHLIEMAQILKSKSIPFTLDIFGAGELTLSLEKKVEEYRLEGLVNLRGNVSFSDELIPFVKKNLDLFVCCHRQSDPSCTYLETYACGVPIVGYANKAHKGILDLVDVGWSVPINDINALVDKVTYLSQNRAEIKSKAINARLFSVKHTFERTFSRRIEQCEKM